MNGYNFTERVRKVLGMAREESARLHHEYVGTEHLLLGLIAEEKGIAARLLIDAGVTLELAHKEVLDILGLPESAEDTRMSLFGRMKQIEGPYGDFAALGEHFNAITVDGLAADARAAHTWLTDDREVDTASIAAIGYCMGGRAAFLANAERPLAASVSYYGGGIATQLLDRVDRLHGPQLLCWGGRDIHIQPEQTRAIDDALRAANKPHTTVTFGEAGHAFFCDQWPAYQPDAASEAWALTIAFLARTTGIAAPRT